MTSLVLDVVLLPSPRVSWRAVELSSHLARGMALAGNPSHFRLGEPLVETNGASVCIPHVSLFMLAVDEREVSEVNSVLHRLALASPAVAAEGGEYRHNSCGAPEVYFRKSPQWNALGRAVAAAVEPLRRGRLREVDPAGERLAAVVGNPEPADPDRVRQLLAYGYDEVVDDTSDRFNPHVTLAWPDRPTPRVNLAGLPVATAFSDVFDSLALCEMGPWGTCLRTLGAFRLRPLPPAQKPLPAQPVNRPPAPVETDEFISK